MMRALIALPSAFLFAGILVGATSWAAVGGNPEPLATVTIAVTPTMPLAPQPEDRAIDWSALRPGAADDARIQLLNDLLFNSSVCEMAPDGSMRTVEGGDVTQWSKLVVRVKGEFAEPDGVTYRGTVIVTDADGVSETINYRRVGTSISLGH